MTTAPRIATPIVDRNGKATTVHRRAVPVSSTTSVAIPPPTPVVPDRARVGRSADLPATATLADLTDASYDPWADLAEDPTLGEETFVLTEIELADYGTPTAPSDYVSEMEFEGEDDEEEDEQANDALEDLYQLQNAIEDGGEIPPLIAVRYADGSTRLLDGNHRAGLALDVGKKTAAAYLLDYGAED